jgi:hypothetical protein
MCENPNEKRYTIFRFKEDGEKEVVERGLTVEEAREHCKKEETKGDRWFDGYSEEVKET